MISGCNEAKNKHIVPKKVAILAAFFGYQGPNFCFKLFPVSPLNDNEFLNTLS